MGKGLEPFASRRTALLHDMMPEAVTSIVQEDPFGVAYSELLHCVRRSRGTRFQEMGVVKGVTRAP